MNAIAPSRQKTPAIYLFDAIATGGMAAGLLLFATPLEGLLGLPAGLLRWVSYLLLPFAGIVAWLALRPTLPAGAAWAVIGINVLWTADSLILLATQWLATTPLGVAFIVGQAAIVAAFAFLQYRSLPG